MHDHTADQTINASGSFSDLIYAEVKQLRLTIGDPTTDHQVSILARASRLRSANLYQNSVYLHEVPKGPLPAVSPEAKSG